MKQRILLGRRCLNLSVSLRTNALSRANSSTVVRNDWSRNEIQEIYDMPFVDLLFRAASVHRLNFNAREVQQCTLLSIKTGGCVEDCKYCSQSSSHKTHVKATPTMKVRDVLTAAKKAKEAG